MYVVWKLGETLQRRVGETRSALEIKAVTLMAVGWFTAATHVYLVEGRPSLLDRTAGVDGFEVEQGPAAVIRAERCQPTRSGPVAGSRRA